MSPKSPSTTEKAVQDSQNSIDESLAENSEKAAQSSQSIVDESMIIGHEFSFASDSLEWDYFEPDNMAAQSSPFRKDHVYEFEEFLGSRNLNNDKSLKDALKYLISESEKSHALLLKDPNHLNIREAARKFGVCI